jgi:hypothetical protein
MSGSRWRWGPCPILLPGLFGSGLVSYAADNIGTNSPITAPSTTTTVPRLSDRTRREGDVAFPQSRKPPRLRYGEPGLRQKQPTSVLGIQPCDVVSTIRRLRDPWSQQGKEPGSFSKVPSSDGRGVGAQPNIVIRQKFHADILKSAANSIGG